MSPKFGWESGCPIDDFLVYNQHANSQSYSDESDGYDNEDVHDSENESG